jgi:hypothetical protein
MCKKLFFRILLILLAANLCLADVTWDNSGGDNLWTNNLNWSTDTLPDSATGASLYLGSGPTNGPLISDAATALEVRVGGLGGGVSTTTLRIVAGGSLTTTNFLMVGVDSPSIRSGIVDMTGGTVILGTGTRANGHLYIAHSFAGTTGLLQISGGSIDVGGTFSIANGAGTTGHADLLGGTIITNSFQMAAGGETADASMDIAQGTLIINGDQTALINTYIGNGWLTAYGGSGAVEVDYNVTNAGKTTVRATSHSPYARFPSPASNDVNVPPYVTLGWTAGDYAVSHDIYLGDDLNQVLNATPSTTGIFQCSQPADVNTFEPSGLEFAKTYYWRIDEVNDATVWKGPVWQFTTNSYITLDNFESYADTAALLVSWKDGSDSSSGSTASLSTSIGHDQNHSLVFDYNNTGAGAKPCFSEISRSNIYHDWTIASIAAIDLWYKGNPSNAPEQMYIAVEDNDSNSAIVVNSDPNAAKAADWQVWRIALRDFGGVNLADVKKIYVGFGNRSNPQTGGSGTVYVDDIQLHPRRCLYPPTRDLTGDNIVNFDDLAVFSQKWLVQTTP